MIIEEMLFNLEIEITIDSLLQQEDTDGDKKITIEDKGPKEFTIFSTEQKKHVVKGTYFLSNLLQELVIAKNEGNQYATIPLSKIEELPTQRISRLIKNYYWKGLTRTMDENGVERLLSDTKNETLTSRKLRIYIPFEDDFALKYYQQLEKKIPITAIRLPENVTPEFVKNINKKPGILALKLIQQNNIVKGVSFVVPGGRFNEMYGWDSYFEAIGLLQDEKVDLAKAMADNFQYEIENYGKILNANRSYYLTRTQPPFYSSLIREVFEITNDKNWLASHLQTAIKEYETVWMVKGERLVKNGLNRYLAEGIGMPPECEKGHFDSIIKPYADKIGLSLDDYIQKYNENKIVNKELDVYFIHDRSVRESGHDTSYRIEGNCADLNLVELNAMLFKYEQDFECIIKEWFNDDFIIGKKKYTSAFWQEKSAKRKALVNQFLWNETKGLYVDFNFKIQQQSSFIAATTFAPLWAKMATKEQAQKLVETAIPLLKEKGGIAGSSKCNTKIEKGPARQWDYPNGWAPHQMMIWRGLLNYEYNKEAQELIYRWLYMITKNAVDYNGTIPEKYDVVTASHKVFAEYGNVGTDFEYITQEGFGWMNASYQYGLSLLSKSYKEDLDRLKSPDKIFKN